MMLQIFYHLRSSIWLAVVMLYFPTDAIKADVASSQTISLEKSNLPNDYYIGPYLDGNEVTNITVQIGTNAYLPCKVKQLGNKSVSWVRVRDDHILTVDRSTFIADERFQPHFKEISKEWILQIKFVQSRDSGTYECQVSTEPKVSAKVQLNVVVPRTELIGESDRFVKSGSRVVIRCIIKGALESPSFIIWFHGPQQLMPDNQSGFLMDMTKGSPDPNSSDIHKTIGRLVIESTKKSDSGNYTCSPSNSPPATVTLHILNSESSASAVTSSASQRTYGNLFGLIISIAIFLRQT